MNPNQSVPTHVVHLITDLASGGAQALVRDLVRLSTQGGRFRHTVVSLFRGNTPLAAELQRAGIPVVDLQIAGRWPLPGLWRLWALLRRERPTILHGWLFHAALLARVLGRAAGVPVVVTSRQNVSVGGPARERLLALTAGLDDAVIACSELVRQAEIEAAGAHPDKVVTVRNFVAADTLTHAAAARASARAALGLPADAFVIGSVGRMRYVKGFDLLLDAFARLRPQTPHARLVLVGDGDQRAPLEAQARRAGLGNSVLFLGDRRDVPRLLPAFDLFALPSRWEGIPVAILEAMAAHVPVVAAAVGGTPEAVRDGETGLLVPPEDVAALTAALQRLINDAPLRARLVEGAAALVASEFSATGAVAAYEEVYGRLLAQKGLPAAGGPPRRRVLHPITRLIVGGAQENTMLTAALLDKDVWEVEILSGTQLGSEGSLMEAVRDRGIPLILEPALVREVNPLQDARALWRMFRLMRRGGYAVVHTHSSKAGILGRWAAKLAGVPVIVHTVHGWGHHERQHPLVRAYYILLEKLSLPVTDRLIVVSALNIEKGLADGIGRRHNYTLIRSGIELDRFGHPQVGREETRAAWGIPPHARVVGSVTRLSAQKAPLDFVRAAAAIRREWEADPARAAAAPVWFLVVGDGDLRPQVEALAAELGVADRLVLTGLRRDVPELLAAMDIFALSSLWEGLPRVLPQAMATRLPIVATAADGSAEAVTPGVNGFLTPPGDPVALAGLVLQLLHNPALAQQMGAAGRARVDEFSDTRMVAQIDALYRELLEKKGFGIRD